MTQDAYLQPVDPWPLEVGDTLSNHDWFPFYGHRFLSSKFVLSSVMNDRRADIGTAVILWAEAMRQDPGGTLPDCDLELAALARFSSVAAWAEVRETVLHGWRPVLVRDPRTGETFTRLGHIGFMQGVVEEMQSRKRARDGAREAGRLAVKKSRIRKKLGDMRLPDYLIKDDAAIEALADHFDKSDQYITPDNLRGALVAVLGWQGQVAPFPGAKSGGAR